MNVKDRFSIIILGIFLIIICCDLAKGEKFSEEESVGFNILSEKVDSFVLENASINDAVTKLRQLGFRVCFEELEKGTKETPTGEVLISLELHDKTVENVLNEITKRAPDYIWKRQENMNILNIFPKRGSALNWKIPLLKAEKESFIDLLEKRDILDLKKHDIIFFYRGFSQPLEVLISIDLKDNSVMECLNTLVNLVPRLCWTLKINPRGKRVLSMDFASFSAAHQGTGRY